ncbi:MAG: hypothetical protein R3C56_06300 [Pirellulaceae bacterium]
MKRNASARDLFYRINVIQLHLPPLRGTDVLMLTKHFVERFAARRGLSKGSMKQLQNACWPTPGLGIFVVQCDRTRSHSDTTQRLDGRGST